MSHTKGKWIVVSHIGGDEIMTEKKDIRIASVCCGGMGVGATDTANARLIAATPELLELCEEAVIAIYEGDNADPIETSLKIKAMIKKLTGRVFDINKEVFVDESDSNN